MHVLYVGIIIYVYEYCSRHTAYNTGFKLSFLEYLAEFFPVVQSVKYTRRIYYYEIMNIDKIVYC